VTAPEPTPRGDRVTNRRLRRPGRGRSTHATVAALLALAVTACGSGSPQEDRLPNDRPSETTTTNSDLAAQAMAFGGIVLPPSAKVLAATETKAIDQLYTLAIEIGPNSTDTFLSGSKFTTPLTPGRKVFMPPALGFDPNNSSDIASAQDRLLPEGQRTHAVTREILIDRGNPAKPIVHLWLFTT
jgi:hypothetical protein